MIAHLRIYTVREGMMDDWLALFRERLVPLMAEHGIEVESAWVNPERTEFVWIRSYGERPEDIERKEAAFYGSHWWRENVDFVRSHLAARDVRVIESI